MHRAQWYLNRDVNNLPAVLVSRTDVASERNFFGAATEVFLKRRLSIDARVSQREVPSYGKTNYFLIYHEAKYLIIFGMTGRA